MSERARVLNQQDPEAQKHDNDRDQVIAYDNKLAALGEMAAGVGHEINNPLAIVQAAARKINRTSADDETRRNATLILDSVARISAIIDALRLMSSEGEGDEIKPVPINSLLKSCLSLCSERMKSTGVVVKAGPFPSDMMIHCRQSEMVKVVVNLLSNAYDAVQGCQAKEVKIEYRLHGGYSYLSVVDTGHGVSPQIKSKIFEPFFTTKEVGKGAGLGLSVSRSIVMNHGGDLFFESVHEDTRFTIRLPVTSQGSPRRLA